MCNDFFNPLADSEPIISRELQFLNKHADLCRKLIYLVFFFQKIQMCWNYDKVNITSIVSKIPAAVLRHVLTSPKQLNKIKVICPLISYLLSYTEFFTRKGIKTHFLIFFYAPVLIIITVKEKCFLFQVIYSMQICCLCDVSAWRRNAAIENKINQFRTQIRTLKVRHCKFLEIKLQICVMIMFCRSNVKIDLLIEHFGRPHMVVLGIIEYDSYSNIASN